MALVADVLPSKDKGLKGRNKGRRKKSNADLAFSRIISFIIRHFIAVILININKRNKKILLGLDNRSLDSHCIGKVEYLGVV